ncbi:MAG: DUF4236 domain-containing protein [Proteobacteria bacterium]|nr:DUF4236 domain-containing protein [Pseudomonadota bacterium]
MGWSLHKSINFGPVRVNAGKTGLSFSVGQGPFRVGASTTGRTYGSATVPGTGLRYTQSFSKGTRPAEPTYLGWIAAAGMFIWQKFLKG